MGAFLSGIAVFATVGPASADHVYPSGAHWSLEALGGVVTIENNLGPEWDVALEAAIAQWERSARVRFEIGPPGACDDGIGTIELCAARYPGVTWIALTSLYRGEDEHVDYSVVDLNLAKRWGKAKRRFALCHELGHTLGLTHRPETSGSSCMLARFAFVTNRPAKADAHDLEQVDALYEHAHGSA